MLLDFAEHINADVYVLGATFLKLVRTIKLNKIPLVDPCLFIQVSTHRMRASEKWKRVLVWVGFELSRFIAFRVAPAV